MEAARQLKEDNQTRAIPIIAISGDQAQIFASGCAAHNSKPFNVAEFLKLVECWIVGMIVIPPPKWSILSYGLA